MSLITLIKLLFLLLFLSLSAFMEKTIPFQKRNESSSWVNLSFASLGVICSVSVYYTLLSLRWFVSPGPEFFTYSDLLITILSLDGLSYGWHVINHRWSLLWRLHRCHHSELYLAGTSAFRFHFIETTLGLLLRIVVIYWLGLSSVSVLVFEIIFMFFNIFQHSNIQLRRSLEKWMECFFVTPAMHRAHHDVGLDRQNSNFSTIFSFWDRIFGSYVDNSHDAVKVFGLNELPQPQSFYELVVLPFKTEGSSES